MLWIRIKQGKGWRVVGRGNGEGRNLFHRVVREAHEEVRNEALF